MTDAFGAKVCALCRKWTRRYVYWGPTHEVPLCVTNCVDYFARVVDLHEKAKEANETNDE